MNSVPAYAVHPPSPSVSDYSSGPAGMPSLVLGATPISFYEFWPAWKFYWPVVIAMCLLAVRFRGVTLPTIANPTFDVGGFIGESKNQILNHARHYIGNKVAPFVTYAHREGGIEVGLLKALKLLKDAGLSFPVVAKPDMACRGAGVQPIYNVDDLRRYIGLLHGDVDILLQTMISAEGEAGIFYVREPDQPKGRIISITLKYFPYVTGNGIDSLHRLIERDARASALTNIYLPRFAEQLTSIPAKGQRVRLAFAGNHSKGTIFRDGTDQVTPAMTAMFDQLSQQIPGFYFGRYDIRFDDFQRLRDGQDDFTILEINGSGAEATHIWDARVPLLKAWRDVIHQFYLAWKIGAINRSKGHKALSIYQVWKAWRREKQLTLHYPPTL